MLTPMKEVLDPSPAAAAAAAVMVEEESNDAFSATANNKAEAWTCSCGKRWPAVQKRCGNTKCNKWKGGKRDAFIVHRPNAPSPPKKQPPPQDAIIKWTCHHCQHVMPGEKVRCGKCHRWKGGKRMLFKKTVKNDSSVDNNAASLSSLASADGAMGQNDDTLNDKATNNNNANITATAKGAIKASCPYDTTQDWTCPHCSIVLPEKQTRCGKCNKWRGGKRQGGWTIKAKKKWIATSGKEDEEEEEDRIDRTLDWTCCGVILPAKQTRCGKCFKWRGGKRVSYGNNDGNKNKRVKSGGGGESESNEKVKVVSNYQLQENDQLEVSTADVQHQHLLLLPPPPLHQHHSLANDRADIVFEYPMSMPSTSAAAPLYTPSMPPSVSTEEYYPLPSPIAMNLAEI